MKRIYVKGADGVEVDISEGVAAMYDLLVDSMDWGSGLLTLEDALPIADLAKACGFKQWEEAERYVARRRERESKRESKS